MTSRFDSADALIAPLYFVAALLVATPMMDFVTSILPIRIADLQWRFATVGLLSGFLLTPLLGVVIALAVAIYAEHVGIVRVLSIVSGILAVAFLLVLVLFLLDIVQLRSAVQDQARSAFQAAAVKAVVKHLTFIVATAWLGVRGIRAARWAMPSKRRGSSVVVGG